MIHFFIDTAASRIILGIIADGEVLKEINVENSHDLSTRIFPLIDELFSATHVCAKDVTRIYVVNGPGSFTGVRIGVTIAKTMAWTLKKEIVTISELELMATTNTSTTYIVPMIDARREAIYGAIYDRNGNIILKEQYITTESLLNQIPDLEDVTFLGYEPVLKRAKIETPVVDLRKMIARHQTDLPLNPHQVNPNYLKQTEAEENLEKQKHD